MYCFKCGKEIAENASFCSNCGTAIGFAGPQRGSHKTSVSRVIATICQALILWLCFQEWVIIDASFETYGISSLKYVEYVEKLADWGLGDIGTLQVGSVALLVLNVVVIIIAGVCLLKEAMNDENRLNWEYGTSDGIIAIMVAIILVFFITGLEPLAATPNIYYILVLATVNRFLILPRYASDEYYRKKEEQKNRAKAPIKQTIIAGDWKCTECGEKNEQTALSCKNCGKYK